MSKNKPTYLDYASTTPDERVEKMLEYMTFNNNGNAASRSHSFGWYG